MASWSLQPWLSEFATVLPWPASSWPTPHWAQMLSQWLSFVPYWSIALVGAVVLLAFARYRAALFSVLIAILVALLGVEQLTVELFGWWLPVWLISYGLTLLICRYLGRWLQFTARPVSSDSRWWPIWLLLLGGLCLPHGVVSSCIVIWLAVVPLSVYQRLQLQGQVPKRALQQAALLGADRRQRVLWVAQRWLKLHLAWWRYDSAQQTLLVVAAAGWLGFPGLGQQLLQAFASHDSLTLLHCIISLFLGWAWLRCFAPRLRSQP